MKYLFKKELNDEKDLKHIEWLVEHSNEYHFSNSSRINYLKKNINKKNIYYSRLNEEYNNLVKEFNNNPYNYQYNVLDINNNTTANINNYFITINNIPASINYYKQKKEVNSYKEQLINNSKHKVMEQFVYIEERYNKYIEHIGPFINEFKNINCGKDYNFVLMFIELIIYNYLLFNTIISSNIFKVLWSFFGNGITSIELYYTSNTILGVLSLLLVVYFIYVDIVLVYGLYYLFYIIKKANNIYKQYQYIEELHNVFKEDFEGLLNNQEDIIKPTNHRKDCYLPLIDETSKYYTYKENELVVPLKAYNKRDIFVDIIFLSILYILVLSLRYYI